MKYYSEKHLIATAQFVQFLSSFKTPNLSFVLLSHSIETMNTFKFTRLTKIMIFVMGIITLTSASNNSPMNHNQNLRGNQLSRQLNIFEFGENDDSCSFLGITLPERFCPYLDRIQEILSKSQNDGYYYDDYYYNGN